MEETLEPPQPIDETQPKNRPNTLLIVFLCILIAIVLAGLGLLAYLHMRSDDPQAEVAAFVNDRPILKRDVEYFATFSNKTPNSALETLIDEELLAQEAERRGLLPSDEELTAFYEDMDGDPREKELTEIYSYILSVPKSERGKHGFASN